MTATPAQVRLYVLDTGVIASSDFSEWSPSAPPGARREMSVRSYLVVHPDGVLLWDTGIADAIGADPAGTRITDTVVFRVPTTLRDQLEAIGRDPGDIDSIGLSHMHIDHVGNLDQFPGAKILVQRDEHAAAFGPDPERLTYIPEAYAAGAVRQGNVDVDASRRSIEVARRLERERGATVWLHHDLRAQRAVRTAPAFYA